MVYDPGYSTKEFMRLNRIPDWHTIKKSWLHEDEECLFSSHELDVLALDHPYQLGECIRHSLQPGGWLQKRVPPNHGFWWDIIMERDGIRYKKMRDQALRFTAWIRQFWSYPEIDYQDQLRTGEILASIISSDRERLGELTAEECYRTKVDGPLWDNFVSLEEALNELE